MNSDDIIETRRQRWGGWAIVLCTDYVSIISKNDSSSRGALMKSFNDSRQLLRPTTLDRDINADPLYGQHFNQLVQLFQSASEDRPQRHATPYHLVQRQQVVGARRLALRGGQLEGSTAAMQRSYGDGQRRRVARQVEADVHAVVAGHCGGVDQLRCGGFCRQKYGVVGAGVDGPINHVLTSTGTHHLHHHTLQ